MKQMTATKPGLFWFFHHDHKAADNDVNVELPCRVFELDDPTELVMSAVVPGFRRVEIAKDTRCPNMGCKVPLTPQCFRCDETTVEVICGRCHITVLRADLIEIAEDNDFDDGDGE
jgi:hypothetical protein